jgi:hypothetical protein
MIPEDILDHTLPSDILVLIVVKFLIKSLLSKFVKHSLLGLKA